MEIKWKITIALNLHTHLSLSRRQFSEMDVENYISHSLLLNSDGSVY